MTTEDPNGPEPLPGLEEMTDRQKLEASRVALAVRRSIAALEEAELVTEIDSARLALAGELADIIAIKKRTGRLSTVGNDARVLVDLLDRLLPEAFEVNEKVRVAMERWEAMMVERFPSEIEPSA